ncbi:MAG: GWxTD domain-containing protein [bacterium]
MNVRLLTVLAAGAVALAGAAPRLAADWAVFQGEADSSRVEVFYSVPYRLLNYVRAEQGLEAKFAVRFEMSGPGFEREATLYRRGAIESFAAAEEADRTFVDGFSLAAPAGRYLLRVTLSVLDSAVRHEEPGFVPADVFEDSIEVPAFRARPDLSTLQLASGVVHDSASGGFSVVPNPSRVFGADRVYFYYEGYGLSPAADSYELATAVIRPAAETLVASRQARHKGGRERVSAALGVSVEGLAPGEYRLAVTMRDRATGATAGRVAPFRVAGADEGPEGGTVYRLQMTPLEAKYHDRLEFIASPRELAYYRALGDSGKQSYLAWFWSRHNLAEFARRMETASERFRSMQTDGLRTDRGRIYVKYGQPDEIDRRVLEIDRRPREYWSYYAQGHVFVFIDITGSDDYRLAWTNSPDEPRTGYEGLLTPDEQETFR